MEEKTMRVIVNKLGMGDCKEIVLDKVLKHEEILMKSGNEDYKSALNNCNEMFQVLHKEIANTKELKKVLFRFEEYTNDLNLAESKYMYESGFNDGLKFAFDLMEIIR